MDPWKAIRLGLCIAVCVGILAAGTFARLGWGVPEYPYGYWRMDNDERIWPRSIDPFRDMSDFQKFDYRVP